MTLLQMAGGMSAQKAGLLTLGYAGPVAIAVRGRPTPASRREHSPHSSSAQLTGASDTLACAMPVCDRQALGRQSFRKRTLRRPPGQRHAMARPVTVLRGGATSDLTNTVPVQTIGQ